MSERGRKLRALFRATAIEQLAQIEPAIERLRRGALDPEAEAAIAPVLHLLKGDAALVGLMELAAALHAAEGRAAVAAWDALANAVTAIGRDLLRVDGLLDEVVPEEPPEPEPEVTRGWAQLQTDAIDQLSQRLLELSNAYNRLAAGLVHALEDVPPEALRALSADADAARRQLDEVLGAAWSLRLTSVEDLLQRVAVHGRELAAAQDKPLEVRIDGGAVELEPATLAALEGPLLELVHNAVLHGIEEPGARGDKPAAAALVLEARAQGGMIEIAVEDDGRGLDPAVVRAAAAQRGVLTGEAAAAPEQAAAFELLIESGAGTQPRSEHGLEAVRARIEELGGAVALSARPGLGTRCVIAVPAAIARERAVVVECAGSVLAFPTRAVHAQLRLGEHPRRRIGGRDAVWVGATWVAVCGLDEALELGPKLGAGRAMARTVPAAPAAAAAAAAATPALLLEGHGRRRAFVVDRIAGEQELLRRPAGAAGGPRDLVVASSIIEDGRTALWPSVPALLGGARVLRRRGRLAAASIPPPPRPRTRKVLIADDSPLVLEVVKAILRGVELIPTTAPDGEAALAALEAELPDLLITDVEMPRLDGLGLLRHVHKRWPRLPVVVLTTRDGVEDRRYAMSLGASAYLSKQELDESRLTQIVCGLIDVPKR